MEVVPLMRDWVVLSLRKVTVIWLRMMPMWLMASPGHLRTLTIRLVGIV